MYMYSRKVTIVGPMPMLSLRILQKCNILQNVNIRDSDVENRL